MVVLALALIACGGSEPEAPAAPEPAPVAEAPAPEVAAPVADGISRRIELDAAGGLNGAPADAAFIVPVGADASVSMTELDGGARGVRISVQKPSDALVCTQALPVGDKVVLAARLRVVDIKAGPGAYDGLNLELRARGAGGELLSPPTTRYVLLTNLKQAGDWQEFETEIVPPAGTVRGELCTRFVASTGTAEIDWFEIRAPGTARLAAASSDVATTPVVEKRWELDAAGGGNGAPAGFDFIVPPTAPGVKATAGDIGGATGLRLEVSQAGNALACSEKFPVAGTQVLTARMKVEKVKADARAWTGFVTELRTWDAAGALVSPPGGQYTTLDTVRDAGDWRELRVPFAAPAGAVDGRVCVRFVESTGTAVLDWMAVGG